MKRNGVDIFYVVKKEMNDVNEESFLPKQEDYKNKKKRFLNNVRSLKNSFPKLKKKGNMFSRSMEKLSKKFFKNDGYKKHYSEIIRCKFMVFTISLLVLLPLSITVFDSFTSLHHAFKSDHYVEIGFFTLSTLLFLGLSLVPALMITPLFSSKVNYLVKLKDMIGKHNNDKKDFIINQDEYLKTQSCVQNLEHEFIKITDCSLVDKVVSKNIIEHLKKNLTGEQKKTLSMFCNDERNITYREILKFANYIEKGENFKRKVLWKKKKKNMLFNI